MSDMQQEFHLQVADIQKNISIHFAPLTSQKQRCSF